MRTVYQVVISSPYDLETISYALDRYVKDLKITLERFPQMRATRGDLWFEDQIKTARDLIERLEQVDTWSIAPEPEEGNVEV